MAKNEESKKQLPISKDEFDKLVDQCLDIIEQNHILFISDLIAFVPFSRATFYNYGLDKLDILKDAINTQRIFVKQALRSKWFKSNCATRQIALYKLISTPEEREILNNKSADETGTAQINVMGTVKLGGKSLNLNIGDDPNADTRADSS